MSRSVEYGRWRKDSCASITIRQVFMTRLPLYKRLKPLFLLGHDDLSAPGRTYFDQIRIYFAGFSPTPRQSRHGCGTGLRHNPSSASAARLKAAPAAKVMGAPS